MHISLYCWLQTFFLKALQRNSTAKQPSLAGKNPLSNKIQQQMIFSMAPTRLNRESEERGERRKMKCKRGRGGEGGRHFIAQQCGRQKEREVESERERDYCLLESSNLELCHEYQRLYSPTVNASLCSPHWKRSGIAAAQIIHRYLTFTLRCKTTQLSTPCIHNYSNQTGTHTSSEDTFSVDVQQLKKMI